MEDEDEDLADAGLAALDRRGGERAGSKIAYGIVSQQPMDLQAALQTGNVQVAAVEDHLALTVESAAAREQQEALLNDLQLRRRARSLAIPTADKAVRAALRSRGEPVTLFGEREMERRERLRLLLASMDAADGGELQAPADAEVLTGAPPKAELFYTEGSDALLQARLLLAKSSLAAAAARLGAEHERWEAGLPPAAVDAGLALASRVAALQVDCSQVADGRPLSALALSPGGDALLSGGWSGTVSLWRALTRGCERALTVRAHEERVSGVAWHPSADEAAAGALAFATAACDKMAKLWSADGTLLHTLRGHSDRLGRCAFHPAGLHLATAGFDATWRLWDVATGAELLCQEGHSRAVYAVAFQRDGALALSGGLDAHARVWDMRTGRSVLTLSGHVRSVLCADWSPDGHTIATGAGDACCRVWDARRAGACVATLPAHGGLVTAVRFEAAAGGALLTASHDGTFKLWQAPRWGLLRAVRAGEDKVMAADVAPGCGLVATASYDRLVKVWSAVPPCSAEDDEMPYAHAV